MPQKFLGLAIQRQRFGQRLFASATFQFCDALQLLAANPCAAMISLLQLEMAARACMETSVPFHEEADSASQELNAARAANSLADDNSMPLHEVGADI
jgi:hypothetical protein